MAHTRRRFLATLGASAAGLALAGCRTMSDPALPGGGIARLTARPRTPSTTIQPGTSELTSGNPNDGFLFVPASYDPAKGAPLVVALHGAGALPTGFLNVLSPYATSRNFLLMVPGSRGLTWDAITYKFAWDVTFIDSALKWTFERCVVNASRIGLVGFSDGATYGLGLGLANGDLFTNITAFSPAFIAPSDSLDVGHPRFFLAHGTRDAVLNIDGASRRIVPDLRGLGYDVTYVEFDGGHEINSTVLAQEIDWFLA